MQSEILLFLSSEKDTFTDELVDLLARLAGNISFALENFDRDAEKRQADEQIQYLATHDALTGLPNRAMFNELLDLSIKSARRNGRKCAVLFIDLDRFKIINDTLGHAAGDALLVEVGHKLRSSVRESDVVVRLGGDEFIIILNEISDERSGGVNRAQGSIGREPRNNTSRSRRLHHREYWYRDVPCRWRRRGDFDEERRHGHVSRKGERKGARSFCFFEPEMDASLAAHNKLASGTTPPRSRRTSLKSTISQ